MGELKDPCHHPIRSWVNPEANISTIKELLVAFGLTFPPCYPRDIWKSSMETFYGNTHRLWPTTSDAKRNIFARESLHCTGHRMWPGKEQYWHGLSVRAVQQCLWTTLWQPQQDWFFPTMQDEQLAKWFSPRGQPKKIFIKKKTFLPHWKDSLAITDS